MVILNQLSKDLKNNHSLYCSSTDYKQFYLLDSILTTFKKFEVSNIVLIDPKSISHNPWKQYIKDVSTEMVQNDFVVLSKHSETFADPAIDVITNSLNEEFGESYISTLAKIVDPSITRYELGYKESKLTLYHITYDVASTLLLLHQMNCQEHYASTCSTGLLLNSIVGDWGVIAHDSIQSFVMKKDIKIHYIIRNDNALWSNFTKPIPLTKELVISFEAPFLGEYFEILSL
jgi:hypothetical protein